MSALVKGFGCRPVVTYPRVLRAGVRKPPRKEPAGAGREVEVAPFQWTVCQLAVYVLVMAACMSAS